MDPMIRIGNAAGFWGDRIEAAAELVSQQPDLDYLTLDYLAEVSMSIMARQQQRDATVGYARDFLDTLKALLDHHADRVNAGPCIVTNAGGLNPRGCAEACTRLLRSAGHRGMRIGVVSGDDVATMIRGAAKPGRDLPYWTNLETGQPITDVLEQIVTANAYLGARPIVEAIQAGADMIITGRVADPSMTVAPCVARFGWSWQDYDRLAGATIAGHLIECGTQVTGGISADWLQIPDPARIGYPVVEVSADGTCVVTKPRGTGGRVDEPSVKEQLVYEIGDPDNYLSPDVIVSFLSLEVESVGEDRVHVKGAKGRPPPPTLKVSATLAGGFGASGTLTIVGSEAKAKAQRCAHMVRNRLQESGSDPRQWLAECLGGGDVVPVARQVAPRMTERPSDTVLEEVVLRISVRDASRQVVDRFARELMPLVTAGPQGVTGYAAGRPRVHEVFGYWPFVIDRHMVESQIEILEV